MNKEKGMYVLLDIIECANITITTRAKDANSSGVILIITTEVLSETGRTVSASTTSQFVPQASIKTKNVNGTKQYHLIGGV